ncbi:hypothetical protein KKF84_00320 [Myxococcota bacterium]|nr:hypothetical protein [Myxococcota bacterium]MBU1533728.1 hypothetical protein [Myxococcota bacterium]
MKHTLVALITLFGLITLPATSEACIQKLKAEKTTVKVGDTVSVTASIKWIHHPCVLDIDEVNFKWIGVKKVSKISWSKKGRGKYFAAFKVKITAKKAMIKMWRECSKSGKHGTELTFTVK